ncbi:MAG: hypothetical protein ACFCU8_06460 [Thermosynechococcaceae cyanobacterium]
MRVGTLPWLLRHEWRLWRRSPYGETCLQLAWTTCVIAGIICVGIIGVDFFSTGPQDFRQHLTQHPDVGLWIAISISALFFEITFFDSLSQLFAALEQTKGRDFLLASSPISIRRLFMMQFGKLFSTAVIGG